MFNNILIVTELEYLEDADKLVATALEMTKDQPSTVYRVAGIISAPNNSFVSSFLPKNFDKMALQEGNIKLHEFTQKRFPVDAKVQHVVAYGTIYEEVTRIADELEVDLIIMKAAKDGARHSLSSNTVKVARNTERPMLIIR